VQNHYLLVHGAWHGAWCFERIIPHLRGAGHGVTATDLPAHGPSAGCPSSYFHRPLSLQRFATERCSMPQLSVANLAASLTEVINNLPTQTRIILMGHSVGGAIVSAVAETVPERVSHVVYLCGFMPASGMSLLDYIVSAEDGESAAPALLLANPTAVGAFRIDPRSTDTMYQEQLKSAFAGDASADDWCTALNRLVPDEPVRHFEEPSDTTGARWGAIPRTYIKCTADRIVPTALQDRFIREADEFTPRNKTTVHTLATGHSPWLSAPVQVAEVLLSV
jgi:pimeloyl-ACP methyl ester carboxylesterase